MLSMSLCCSCRSGRELLLREQQIIMQCVHLCLLVFEAGPSALAALESLAGGYGLVSNLAGSMIAPHVMRDTTCQCAA